MFFFYICTVLDKLVMFLVFEATVTAYHQSEEDSNLQISIRKPNHYQMR